MPAFRASYSGPGTTPGFFDDEQAKRDYLLTQTTSPARLPEDPNAVEPTIPGPAPAAPVEAPAPPPDVYAELAQDPTAAALAARQKAEGLRSTAVYSGLASDALAALSGSKVSRSVPESLRADANRVEQDAVEDRGLADLAAKARAMNEANDPNSASNTRARAMYARVLPASITQDPSFARQTEAQLAKVFGLQGAAQQQKLALDKDAREQANQAFEQGPKFRQEQLHQGRQDAAAWVTANRVSNSLGLGPDGKPRGAGVDDRFRETALINLGKDMSKLAEVTTALKNVDALVPGLTDGKLNKSKYALGPGQKIALSLPGGVGENMVSQDALAMDKAQRSLIDLVSRARTGAVINEDEAKLYATLFSARAGSDPEGFATAAHQFKRLLYERIKQREAPHAAPVDPSYEILSKFQGIKYTEPFFDSVRDAGDEDLPAYTVDRAPRPAPVAAPQAPQAAAAPAAGKVTPSGKPYARMQKNSTTGQVRYLDATGNVVEVTGG